MGIDGRFNVDPVFLAVENDDQNDQNFGIGNVHTDKPVSFFWGGSIICHNYWECVGLSKNPWIIS